MNVLEKNRKLLTLGTKLRMCADYENAALTFEAYVRGAAKISEDEDSLEMLYGCRVYRDTPITNSAEAIICASIAVCAKELIALMRSKFPDESAWQSPSRDNVADAEIISFFEWLETSKSVDEGHYSIIKNAYRAFSKATKICIDTSSSIEHSTLMEVVSGIVNRNIKVIDRKLR
jgi:hypothetical protein